MQQNNKGWAPYTFCAQCKNLIPTNLYEQHTQDGCAQRRTQQNSGSQNKNKIYNNPPVNPRPQGNQRNPIQISQPSGNQGGQYIRRNQQPASEIADIKCEYCQDIYPLMILEEHIQVCEARKSLLRLQQEETGRHPRQHNQQSQSNQLTVLEDDGEAEIRSLRPGHRIRTETLLPDGSVRISDVSMDQHGNVSRTTIINGSNQRGQNNRVIINGMPLTRANEVHPSFPFNRPQQNNRQDHQRDQLQLLGLLQMLTQMRGGSQEQGLEDSELDSINQLTFKPSKDLAEENKKCVICMTEYEQNESLKLLPCTHRFHTTCIDQWLSNHSKCPICKKDVRN